MTGSRKRPRVPPGSFVRGAWASHRAIVNWSGGPLGLSRPTPRRRGTLRLTMVGRRTKEERRVVLGYLENGPNLVLMATNGWAESTPGWWLNLRAHPEAGVDLARESRTVRAREAGLRSRGSGPRGPG